MHFYWALLSQAAAALAVKLYVADSGGNVTTLILSQSLSTSNLSVSYKTNSCAPNPSWLILDGENKLLYCYDRGATSSINGSMNSFSVAEDGNLTSVARVNAPFSGVHARIFGEGNKRGIATASYNKSAYSVIGIGKEGALTEPLQVVYPVLATPGPVPTRQDLSYLHEVLLEPTEKYILMNDLGADLVRVFTWDKASLAPLTEHASLHTEAAVGPRHGVFWKSPSGVLHYFFVGELSQNVYSYQIHYNSTGGLYWEKVFEIPALGLANAKPALTSPPSEIALTPDNKFIMVSNRDISFPQSMIYASGPTDTISTFSIHGNGTLSLLQLAPSGGWLPRQFSLNKKGDMIAIGHQGNKSVVVWKRDLSSGKIDTSAPVGQVILTGPVVATVWDEACD